MTATATAARPIGILFDHDPSLTRENIATDYNVPTLQELQEARGPAANGNRWSPVHWADWIDAIRMAADRRGYGITHEAYSMSKDSHTFASLFNFADDGSVMHEGAADRTTKSFGFFADNLQRSAAKAVAGRSVFICSNGMAQGEILIAHKQTTGLDPFDLLDRAFARWDNEQNALDRTIQALKETPMSDRATTYVLGKAVGLDGNDPIMSAAMARRVRIEYQEPRHEVFRERNAWSLYNAATETMKHEARMSNSTGLRLQQGLARILNPSRN